MTRRSDSLLCAARVTLGITLAAPPVSGHADPFPWDCIVEGTCAKRPPPPAVPPGPPASPRTRWATPPLPAPPPQPPPLLPTLAVSNLRVTVGEVGLTASLVKRSVRQRREALEACTVGRAPTRRVTVHIVIGAHGAVLTAIGGGALPPLGGCLARKIQDIRFPPPEDGELTEAAIELDLTDAP